LKKPMSRNFMESLVAVLGGNIVIPADAPTAEGARHAPQSIDLGLLVDFGFCANRPGCVRALSRRIFKT